MKLYKISKNINEIIREVSENDRIIMSSQSQISFRPNTSQKIGSKPNGLWYACGPEWLKFVTDNKFYYGKYIHKITLNDSGMLMIDTIEKLIDFDKKYGTQQNGDRFINWNIVSQQYYGIEISPYQYDARRSLSWYYYWDVASGCIWNQNAIVDIQLIEDNVELETKENLMQNNEEYK